MYVLTSHTENLTEQQNALQHTSYSFVTYETYLLWVNSCSDSQNSTTNYACLCSQFAPCDILRTPTHACKVCNLLALYSPLMLSMIRRFIIHVPHALLLFGHILIQMRHQSHLITYSLTKAVR